MRCFFVDPDQLDLKHEGRVRADAGPGTPWAIRQLRRDIQFVLAADIHKLQRFGPTGDDLVGCERCRLTPVVRTIKHCSVQQCAAIVHGDLVIGIGAVAFALLQYFVLQAAGRRDDSFFVFVFFEESLAFGLVGFTLLLEFLGVLLLDTSERRLLDRS